jgi:capsular polysaccharide biosynthesis protein
MLFVGFLSIFTLLFVYFDETVLSKHDVESVLFMTESVGMRFAGFLSISTLFFVFFDETVFSKHDVESVLFMTESVGIPKQFSRKY